MSPEYFERRDARLALVYQKYQITSSAQILNIDESRVSACSAGQGKLKAGVNVNGRSKAIELELAASSDHMAIMPVVSFDGQT